MQAVQEAPCPNNVQELRSFLGLVNYYGRFLRNLAATCQPLNQLLRKEHKWKWSQDCEKAFSDLKEQLASAQVLVHCDAKLPLKLACDASSYGLGAVLSHVMADGQERPIAYSSRTLLKQNYSQIVKEALSLIFGVKRFHQFL